MTAAEFRENLLVALDTLRSHKVRSALTVLGIVIGVTSVISVAAIIEGLNRYIQKRVEGLGARTYFLSRIPLGGQNFGRMPEHIRVRKYLNFDDASRLRETTRLVEAVTTFGTRASFFNPNDTNDVRYGAERVDKIIVRGAEPEYLDAVPLFVVGQGRFIGKYDEDHARDVVVIGDAIRETLFPFADPVGKTVRLNGAAYEVIGSFEKDPGLFGGPGVDQFAVIPLSNFRKRYPESKELIMAFTVARDASIDQAREEVTGAMRRIRRVPPSKPDDFEILAPDFLSVLWNQLTGALVILTGVISSVGLLVGGIGVMNIMLISVTERTAEIGVRKAIGARKSDIRVQFLLEATVVTMVGGVLGVAAGAVIAFLVRTLVPSIPASLSLLWIALGIAISAFVGIFFGYYPANRAANLDPIVCLRYE
ncbi:MAG: ABC transporter permease [Bryobacteraceae bacterium]